MSRVSYFLFLQELLEDVSEHLKIRRPNLEPLFGTDHSSSVRALHNAMKVFICLVLSTYNHQLDQNRCLNTVLSHKPF